MKVAAIFGSPRRQGNSETISEVLLEELKIGGADIARYHLGTMKYGGCVACDACKTTRESCVLRDDLTPLLDSMHTVDLLILATPVFFMGVTSQMKAFIDRLYSLMKPRYFARTDAGRIPRGKRSVFILTQRAKSDYFMDILQRYNALFRILGFKPAHIIRGFSMGAEKGAVLQRDEILMSARDTARRLLNNELPLDKIPPYIPGGYSHP